MFLAQLANQGQHLVDLPGVQTVGGFVQNDDVRFSQNGLGQTYPLPVALGQVFDQPAGYLGKSGEGHGLLDLSGPVLLGQQLEPGAEVQIFQHRHVQIQGGLIGQIAHAPLGLLRLLQDVVAVDDDLTLGGGQISGDHVHGGGLTGAVQAQQTAYLALLDGQIQVIHRRLVAISLDQIVDFDHCVFLLTWIVRAFLPDDTN